LLDAWDDRQGLILLTSDHGNLEDLSTRRHTSNPVPALLIGNEELRGQFVDALEASANGRAARSSAYPAKEALPSGFPYALTDITPAILDFLS